MSGSRNAISLFENYMRLAHVPKLEPDPAADPRLYGKKLGLINAATWVQLWSYYFGRMYLPGVQLVNVGNEAVQLHFMRAFAQGLACPPPENIEVFAQYAVQLVELAQVDAILITCSTMNRSFPFVQQAVQPFGVPVIQIDQPLMKAAVLRGGRTLIVATVQTTVNNTRAMLLETAAAHGKLEDLQFSEAVAEEAFRLLGEGRIDDHNEAIASQIRAAQAKEKIDQVVLAQFSMSVFHLTYPEPEKAFGVPVLSSAAEGFHAVKQTLIELDK